MAKQIRTIAQALKEARRRWGPHARVSILPKRRADLFRVYRVGCGIICNQHFGFGRSWDAAFIAAEHAERLWGQRRKRIAKEIVIRRN